MSANIRTSDKPRKRGKLETLQPDLRPSSIAPRSGASDTRPEFMRAYVDRIRHMSVSDKLAGVASLNGTVETLATHAIRNRYPEASEDEVRMRVAARRVPRDLMIRAFGWDVREKGY